MSHLRLRGGIDLGAPPPPPAEETYGPTMGVQAVRDSCMPHRVAKGFEGTPTTFDYSFTTADAANIYSTVLNAGQNKTFWFAKGNYNLPAHGELCVQMLTGQKFYFESAAGWSRSSADTAVMNANGALVACIFEGLNGDGRVTIKGGDFTGVGNSGTAYDAWASAILFRLLNNADRTSNTGATLLEDVSVHDNHYRGASVRPGPAGICTMRRVHSYHNGNNGLTAHEGNLPYPVLVESCRVAQNSYRSADPLAADYLAPNSIGGATKFFVNNTTFDRLWVHDNLGRGLWNDWKHYNFHVTNCVIENNDWAGCFIEAAWGGNTVQHNYFKDNGNDFGDYQLGYRTGNLLFTNLDCTDPDQTGLDDEGNPISVDNDECDVSWNIFDSYGSSSSVYIEPNPLNVTGLSYDRSGTTRYFRGLKVHNNQFWIRGTGVSTGLFTFQSQVDKNVKCGTVYDDPTNEWYENEYHMQDLDSSAWFGKSVGTYGPAAVNWTTWQSVNQHDMAYGGHAASTRELI